VHFLPGMTEQPRQVLHAAGIVKATSGSGKR
jgi:hypothetical protein